MNSISPEVVAAMKRSKILDCSAGPISRAQEDRRILAREIARLIGALLDANQREDKCNAEIEHLQAIVDALSKCNRIGLDGTLVCDVPVMLGMEVWRIAYGSNIYSGRVQQIEQRLHGRVYIQTLAWGASPDECYDSLAAVELAREVNRE